ncbi:hydroxymethylbilane synthase [Brevibacillus laterosporus]|uniref:Porphobilinogen deaminase n=1 Tax=Brevibacillus halotolerans TaxID=1507437 RepID=A0ABT4HTN5_9BACL|nr:MULTISPECIES: hydroxymethylbilane synthase [Brevibacillus]MCR8984339.1 hydroxymethylbilane synthase [Brevibacillus laterosporus]MCZ0830062.1 hydroxymethylbilane synthase [Brevibacillus halotolerans]
MKEWKVGSRKSMLALTQTKWVLARLRGIDPASSFSITEIVTKGDRILDVTLSKVGGKGLFVKEIEQSLLEEQTDMAVHSLKDMPAVLPEGLTIGAIPKREDPRDVLISKDGKTLDELKQGAVVGTSSLRRSSQLLHYRPDLIIKPIRGNIDTRIRKLEEEDFDAIILAAAGLKRVEWKGTITQYLDPQISLPAVGQGALAIECRTHDAEMMSLLQRFDHLETRYAVEAERAFLHKMEGSCQVPIGAYAEVQLDANQKPSISITGMVGSPDGNQMFKATLTGDNPQALGENLAEELLRQGAREVLAKVLEENRQ